MLKQTLSFLLIFSYLSLFTPALSAKSDTSPTPACESEFISNLEKPGRYHFYSSKKKGESFYKTTPFHSLEEVTEILESAPLHSMMALRFYNESGNKRCMLQSYLSEFYPQMKVISIYSSKENQYLYLFSINTVLNQILPLENNLDIPQTINTEENSILNILYTTHSKGKKGSGGKKRGGGSYKGGFFSNRQSLDENRKEGSGARSNSCTTTTTTTTGNGTTTTTTSTTCSQ
jgi:hypothetical protein